MLRYSAAIAFGLALTACGKSTSDYEQAAKANWPRIQAAQAARADDLDAKAEDWDRSAAMARRIAASLGKANEPNRVADGHDEAARDLRAEAAEARALSKATLTKVRNISCAPAAPDPGENCEMTITLRDKQGNNHDTQARWRFDVIDGRLQVVGS